MPLTDPRSPPLHSIPREQPMDDGMGFEPNGFTKKVRSSRRGKLYLFGGGTYFCIFCFAKMVTSTKSGIATAVKTTAVAHQSRSVSQNTVFAENRFGSLRSEKDLRNRRLSLKEIVLIYQLYHHFRL